mmetsp:Transcript_22947/g.68822  ORF Transcript_22947/g.68822 Transcript_22947/m.68822 type:complete len:253 (+) Transcript_22947:922-1680(+)
MPTDASTIPRSVVGSRAHGTPRLHSAHAKPAVSVRTPPPMASAGSARRSGSTRQSSSRIKSMLSMVFSSSSPGATMGSRTRSTDAAQVRRTSSYRPQTVASTMHTRRPVVSSSVSLTKVFPSSKQPVCCQIFWRTRPSNVSHAGPPSSPGFSPRIARSSHARLGASNAATRRSAIPTSLNAAATSNFASPAPSARVAVSRPAALDASWPARPDQRQAAASGAWSRRQSPRLTAPWPAQSLGRSPWSIVSVAP